MVDLLSAFYGLYVLLINVGVDEHQNNVLLFITLGYKYVRVCTFISRPKS